MLIFFTLKYSIFIVNVSVGTFVNKHCLSAIHLCQLTVRWGWGGIPLTEVREYVNSVLKSKTLTNELLVASKNLFKKLTV